MRTKKKHRNEYVRVENVWVRNPYTNNPAYDLNEMSRGDEGMFLKNEVANRKRPHRNFGDFSWDNVVIVSDGYNFKEKQKVLAELPYKDVKIICVNRALANWHMLGKSELQRAVSLYVANNPHVEATSYIPKHGYWPNLLASTRTRPELAERWRGEVFFYSPPPNAAYSSKFSDVDLVLDDYRNPISAAISLCAKLKSQKVLLFCCDSSFDINRPASVELPNGLWTYPQHLVAHNIIDAQLGWLKKNDVEVRSHSSGPNYKNAAYISKEDVTQFFLQEINE